MKPFATPFEPVGVARNYAEMQALLREIADTSGKSRAQIDADGGLPDRYASKALASVPIGTCQLGARTLEKALKGVGAVLIVARATPTLRRAASLGVKRREEQVRARLVSKDVFNAAKALFAKENGKLGAKAYAKKVPLWKRRANARKGARIMHRKRRLATRDAGTSPAAAPPAPAPARRPPRSGKPAGGRAQGSQAPRSASP